MDSRRSFVDVNWIEEKRVLEKSKSLLNWLTQHNFDKIKDEIVHTIRGSPSAYILKSLASFIFDMAMVENSYVLLARLCVKLIHELPPLPESHGEITTFEKEFLRKCQIELESSDTPPLANYVDESTHWGFIKKTMRVLAEVFKDKMVTEATRKSIVEVLMNPILPPQKNTDAMNLFLSSIGKLADLQFSDESLKQLVQTSPAVEMEVKYNDQVMLRKEAEDALARKREEVEMMERKLESYKEEQGKLQLEAQALEKKHEAELLQLRKEAEITVAVEREKIEKLNLQLETLKHERDATRLKAEEFENRYNEELLLRIESEILLDLQRQESDGVQQLLETCIREQENLNSQVMAWKVKYDHEWSLGKDAEDALSKEKQEVEIVKGLLESYNQEAGAMRQERDNALKIAQEIVEARQAPASFFCPITQEMMEDPHLAADGFTYEAEAIKQWLSTGHETSPMTNLKLSHLNLVPNRTLRSAIEELV